MIHGILRDSILGPRIFITYIKDMCKVSSVLKHIIFSSGIHIMDDIFLFSRGRKCAVED